eukprot:7172845-Alexandrium_andersonii.AAC.1
MHPSGVSGTNAGVVSGAAQFEGGQLEPYFSMLNKCWCKPGLSLCGRPSVAPRFTRFGSAGGLRHRFGRFDSLL